MNACAYNNQLVSNMANKLGQPRLFYLPVNCHKLPLMYFFGGGTEGVLQSADCQE
jgi:hypothetical protein